MNTYTLIPDEIGDRLKPNELAVYRALLRYRNRKTGQCDPSLMGIAKKARVSEATVSRALAALVNMGFVERHNEGRPRRTSYTLPIQFPHTEGIIASHRGSVFPHTEAQTIRENQGDVRTSSANAPSVLSPEDFDTPELYIDYLFNLEEKSNGKAKR